VEQGVSLMVSSLDNARSTRPGRSPTVPDGTSSRLTVAPIRPTWGLFVVRVDGELDSATAPGLEAVLVQVITAAAEEMICLSGSGVVGRPPEVVCDLRAVTFLSAAGITGLVRASAHAESRGVEMFVQATHRAVRRPLELTGVNHQLRWNPDPTGSSPRTLA
jgi:anti-sigma B factor antagonist